MASKICSFVVVCTFTFCKQMMDVDSRRSTESHSQFRQGIMQDLKRPYHLEEYLSLLEDWSRQRPPTGHDKNLRNGKVKSYALEGEFGRSYQEMYKGYCSSFSICYCFSMLAIITHLTHQVS